MNNDKNRNDISDQSRGFIRPVSLKKTFGDRTVAPNNE